MKLSSLTLRNWRGIADLTLDLSSGGPMILSGPNGAGKTSVLAAIEWLFTGKNPLGQSRETGLLREGADAGFVSASLAGTEVRRNIKPHSLEIEGLPRNASQAAAEQRLMALAGVVTGQDVARALRPDLFIQLAAKDQSAAWFAILDVRVDATLVEAELKKLGSAAVAAYKAHYGAVSGNLGSAHKTFYAARRDQKRDLKEAELALAQLLQKEEDGKAPAFKQPPDPEVVATKRAQLEQAKIDMGGVLAGQQHRARLREKANGLRESLKEAWDKDRLARNEAELRKIRAHLTELDSPRTRLQRLQAEIASYQGTCCPTCQRLWEDANERAARVMVLTQEEDALKRLVVEESKLRARLEKGEGMVERQHRLAASRELLADIEAELHLVGKEPGIELEALIHRLRDEVAALDAQLTDSEDSTKWIAQKREANEKVTRLTAEVAALEDLVALFGDGPSSIKHRVLKEKSEPIGDQLTAVLSNWGMAARLDGDLVLEVERDGEWRPAYACSDGERILVALALQVWLAQESGTRLVLIDRLEALDLSNLETLVTAVEQLLQAGEIDHAFLAGVDLGEYATLTLDHTHQLLEV